MGIMPAPIIVGNDCLDLFPVPGTTPTMVKAFTGGIEKGSLGYPDYPLQVNSYTDLFQQGPCAFTRAPGVWFEYSFQFAMGMARVSFHPRVGVVAFTGGNVDPTNRFFTNTQVNPFTNHYINGWAFIATAMEMEAWLNFVTPTTGPDPRMELFPMENGNIVLRFASTQDGTNVEIKLDTALL